MPVWFSGAASNHAPGGRPLGCGRGTAPVAGSIPGGACGRQPAVFLPPPPASVWAKEVNNYLGCYRKSILLEFSYEGSRKG